MKIIKISNSDKVNIKTTGEIASTILEGKIVILPTATIYGVSCIYNNKKALEKVYKIKKRERSIPFIILISNLSSLNYLVEKINPAAKILIEHYWNIKNPSPLTIIFKKNKSMSSFITSGSKKIAIRIAGLKFLRQIINISGPIISTSATISGRDKAPITIESIPDEIKEKVDLVINYQSSLPGVESTIVDATDRKPAIIREGEIKYREILEKLNICNLNIHL